MSTMKIVVAVGVGFMLGRYSAERPIQKVQADVDGVKDGVKRTKKRVKKTLEDTRNLIDEGVEELEELEESIEDEVDDLEEQSRMEIDGASRRAHQRLLRLKKNVKELELVVKTSSGTQRMNLLNDLGWRVMEGKNADQDDLASNGNIRVGRGMMIDPDAKIIYNPPTE